MPILVNTDKPEDICDVSDGIVIGRSAEASKRINLQEISRRHAMIRKASSGYWFYDLGSSNGSFVNDKRVAKAICLSDGDVITLGPISFRYDSTLHTSLGIVPEGDEIVDTLKVFHSINAVLLVSDIKGYSTLAEKVDAEALAPVMGRWYALCEMIFCEAGGSIQDFAGDSVFAYWPEANLASCESALAAARQLLTASSEVGRGIVAEDVGLECGVAIHVGTVASGARLVGDAVNLTFRVEGLSRQVDRNLLVTRSFVDSAGGGISGTKYEELGEFQVKGRDGATEIFAVSGE